VYAWPPIGLGLGIGIVIAIAIGIPKQIAPRLTRRAGAYTVLA
jgi:hypothetical protein